MHAHDEVENKDDVSDDELDRHQPEKAIAVPLLEFEVLLKVVALKLLLRRRQFMYAMDVAREKSLMDFLARAPVALLRL